MRRMIMLENQDIHGAILAIMESMKLQGTSSGRLKNFENSFNVFERYILDNSIARIDENICLEYMYAKTGQRFSALRVCHIKCQRNTETRIKALEAAYVDILPTSELPDWSDDKTLMDFLI
jgi:hypothetical protein